MIISTRKNREYTPDHMIIAKQFLDIHYLFMDNPINRDEFTMQPSFHQECNINYGSGNIFFGNEDASKALILSIGES